MSKPRKKRKKVLFILKIIVLLLFIGGLYVYGQISAKLDKIDIQETDLQEQDIVTNDQAPQMTGYTTYALFGLDHRSKNEKLNTENSDTIIIASINNDTKAVKLVSVYRDTLLNVKDDTYSKANAAYALGVDSCWIHRAHEVFDSPEGLELLAKWGLPTDGSLRGVGNCILGYAEDALPGAKPRRDNVVYVPPF